MILVPQEYLSASGLKKRAQVPCSIDTTDKLCNLYKYIDLDKEGFVKVEAENPGRTRINAPLFNDTSIMDKLEYKAMVLMSPENVSISGQITGGCALSNSQEFHASNIYYLFGLTFLFCLYSNWYCKVIVPSPIF
jgi:hypothetical protein